VYGQQVVKLYQSVVRDNLRQMPFDAASSKAFVAWQRKARRILRRILGEMPRKKAPLRLRREVVAETDRYVQERVVYRTRPGMEAPALLMTPKNVPRPAPAVLCPHGHNFGGRGKYEVIDPQASYRAFALKLAEAGCVVLAPDQIGSGERALPEGKVGYGVLVSGLRMVGHTLIGLRHWDLVRGLDLLESLEAVDRRRIGMMGLSLGGEMVLLTGALDRRVRAACVCGFFSSVSVLLGSAQCPCGCLWQLARYFDHADLAAMIAPRALFVECGETDECAPIKDARAAMREARGAYALTGAPRPCLDWDFHSGGHIVDGRRSIPWLLRRLRED
jgi:dienelactone hydrolase